MSSGMARWGGLASVTATVVCVGSNDNIRAGAALVVRGAAHSRLPLGDVLNSIREGIEKIVFAIVWGSIGYALLSQRGTEAEQPSRVN
jgi:hypothetical protein